jgi:hypothetical protein
MKLSVAIAVALAAEGLCQPSAAHADDRWYGWQTLAVDGVADVLFVGGSFGENENATMVGLAVYLLGAPIIHGSHSEWPRAGLSLGLRGALPTAGGLIGYGLCTPDPVEFLRCIGAAVVGIGVGIVVAQAIDSAAIAYGDDDRTTPTMVRLGGSF